MKGTYFLGNGEFETRDMPEHPLAPHEVLIRVAACGVCGTDVHIYHGDKGSAAVTPPVVLGHELSGTVAAVGAQVTGLRVGDHVTVDPNCYCGACHYCRIGKKQLCTSLYAIGVNRDGGFAEYCYAPEAQCFLLAPDVPLEFGALGEPLACCIHGIDRAQIRVGDTVLVIGGGAIGLLMVQLAKLSGASQILLSEPVAMRRDIGLQLGADAAIDPIREDLSARIRDCTGVDGVDVVIECVGNTAATAQAFASAKRGATLLLFSVPKAGATHPLTLEDVYQKELKIVGSMINPDTHQRAVDMINQGRIQLAPIITHRFPVEQLKDAILMQMSSESLKVLVGSSFG
ncbi:zinc-dependent alcohol dehydrogenase family protein [Flavonifractor sp. DFI.6.63]|uniref:Zinc-dependent alcohol dehydrogenase family protein n=1 Tax=Lawsonibacter hominis TaxID=2763053 RepID=A0A8J6J5J4_9FIRM|nr:MULTISPECIES: zinc-dependent alcohol dehydrogenase family protein [Oscillospiraceae]MBS1383373.1 zinc-dependent alcohol dehydrogenase family protein [Flavonifractor sp.]MDU2195638.1 zinc-dependent alcohol dehydrogenase family protein [Clostridiales bacterium]MDY2976594.1 zinc-dependent alcohol dehydrogenase family protein [Oscillospiraceae bacterium]MBC5733121.1 zinc-dependent alcohol dehydrogenase family protein [Lawsonibacter hominis]MCI6398218.1 zinc-dependent alcohol dehydrogenase famil